MDDQSLQLLRSAYDAYNAGDLDGLIALFSADAVLEAPVMGQIHRGPSEIKRSFEDFFEVVESPHTEPLEFIEHGDHVVIVPVRIGGRLRHTGITEAMMPTEMVHVFEVRDGEIRWNYICIEREDAVQAARSRD